MSYLPTRNTSDTEENILIFFTDTTSKNIVSENE